MPDFTRPVPKEDIQKVEQWAEVGHDNRTSLKARSQQRKGTVLFRANYDRIFSTRSPE